MTTPFLSVSDLLPLEPAWQQMNIESVFQIHYFGDEVIKYMIHYWEKQHALHFHDHNDEQIVRATAILNSLHEIEYCADKKPIWSNLRHNGPLYFEHHFKKDDETIVFLPDILTFASAKVLLTDTPEMKRLDFYLEHSSIHYGELQDGFGMTCPLVMKHEEFDFLKLYPEYIDFWISGAREHETILPQFSLLGLALRGDIQTHDLRSH